MSGTSNVYRYQHRFSAVAGAVPATLLSAELAVNVADNTLYLGRSDGSVVNLFGAGGFAATTTPLMDGATALVGTLPTFALADHVHPSDSSRATRLSPDLLGVPLAPTATPDTNTRQIATCAFVIGQASTQPPLPNGTVSAGVSTRYAREDHVHAGGPSGSTQPTGQTLSSGSTVTMNATVLIVNKGTGSPTTVTLPSAPTAWQGYTIKDGKGDAATNPITLLASSGTIDGQSSYTISNNYQATTVLSDGTNWFVV